MPRSKMKVTLIRHTADAEQAVALGARMCYSALDTESLMEQVAQKDQSAFLAGVLGSGHLSVLEHAVFTFAIEGVSRSFLAQITRHRIASFSVQSQRYVSLAEGFDYVVPPAIEALGPEAVAEYDGQMAMMHGWYKSWQDRLGKGEGSNEDARFVLPNACQTQMVVTMNARELQHFLALRCCERAQWEIRAVAREMLRLAYDAAPTLFVDAGPGCLRGGCPEGKRGCGKAAQVRGAMDELKKRG